MSLRGKNTLAKMTQSSGLVGIILRVTALSHYAVLPLLVLIGGLWMFELFLTYLN